MASESLTSHPSCFHVGYALTCEEFDELRAVKPGCCHMCGATGRALEIDHDHVLGCWAVRGLLCRSCNRRIGLIEAGTSPRTKMAERYLATAWHLRHPSSPTKQGRTKPRINCPACGWSCAVKKNGDLMRHWSRLPGRIDERCPGVALEPYWPDPKADDG